MLPNKKDWLEESFNEFLIHNITATIENEFADINRADRIYDDDEDSSGEACSEFPILSMIAAIDRELDDEYDYDDEEFADEKRAYNVDEQVRLQTLNGIFFVWYTFFGRWQRMAIPTKRPRITRL